MIGNVSTLSGPASSPNGTSAKAALEAWVSSVNASGGIKGHPVRLIIDDDRGSVSVAVADAEKLIQSDHVVALVGEDDTDAELSWEKVVDAAKVPLIGGFANELEWESDAYYFPSATTGQALTIATTLLAKAEGGTVFGFPTCDTVASCQQVVPIIKAGALEAGMKWGGSVTVDQNAPSFTAPCLQLKNAHVNSIMEAAGVRFANGCGSQGFEPIQIVPDPAQRRATAPAGAQTGASPVINNYSTVNYPGYGYGWYPGFGYGYYGYGGGFVSGVLLGEMLAGSGAWGYGYGFDEGFGGGDWGVSAFKYFPS